MEWIRTQPCVMCGSKSEIEAHHTESGGMAIKGSDESCVPLCHAHHYWIHKTTRKDDIPNLKQAIERLNSNYAKYNNNN